MVERVSSSPSLGQRPPGWRSSIRSPRWDPPRSMRRPRVRPTRRWSRPTSAGDKDRAGRSGERPVRQSTSSAIRFPMPATLDWSSSRALSGATDPPRAAASWPLVIDRASGPRWVRLGSTTMPPRRLGSRTAMAPPSSKRTMHLSHAGLSRRGTEMSWPTLDAPSTVNKPVMPNRMPTTGPPSVSSRSSFPRRRAAVNRWPTRRRRNVGPVVPLFRYQASGVATEAMLRSTAVSARRR